MRWEDLEAGDVIKFTQEAKERLYECSWVHDREIILIKVEKHKDIYQDGDNIRLWFLNKTFEQYLYINLDGKYRGITLFEIVKLKDD